MKNLFKGFKILKGLIAYFWLLKLKLKMIFKYKSVLES